MIAQGVLDDARSIPGITRVSGTEFAGTAFHKPTGIRFNVRHDGQGKWVVSDNKQRKFKARAITTALVKAIGQQRRDTTES